MHEPRPRGRPRGAASKLAKEARAKAQRSGKLPHEILLSMARREPQIKRIIDGVTGKEIGREYEVPSLTEAMDAAKSAAPYYAPKISTVEVISGVSNDDLDAIIARAAAEAGISLGAGGEGEADEDPDGDGDEGESQGRRRLTDDED